MGSLSSASTDAQVQAQYDNNASYADDNSLAKAKLFREAVCIMIGRWPATMTKGQNHLTMPIRQLQQQLEEVTKWINARDLNSRVGPDRIYSDFRSMRRLSR